MIVDSDDLERHLHDLASHAEGVSLPSGLVVRAASDRRWHRHQLAVGLVCAILVTGAVTAGVFWRVASSTTVPAARPPTVAAAVTIPAAATSALDAYVAKEAAAEAVAAVKAGQSSSLVSVHSAPVADGRSIVAVAAFSYSVTGHPVQALSYAAGQWSIVAELGSDLGPPVQPLGNADLFALVPGTPVSVADVTGDGRPDFLILSQAGDSNPGVVVSKDGGAWRYVPNSGPYPTSDVVGRDPQFQNGKLVSTYDSCRPNCAAGRAYTITWTYQRSSGEFWASTPSG